MWLIGALSVRGALNDRFWNGGKREFYHCAARGPKLAAFPAVTGRDRDGYGAWGAFLAVLAGEFRAVPNGGFSARLARNPAPRPRR
ncbi:hypothetical protein BX589_116115 [Paraburkholderia fungorum]|nr:hypothetical protein [Paraburkholderia fungorum]PRZ52021.1 hypothetical protein BX589_116115 [Paraburkholderia fungorum]